jgi:hydroxypyruvate isomerase
VEITAEELARVASAAEAAITLILELLNSKAAHLNYQADHTGWVVKVCGLIVSSRVKLLFNIYRMRIMEGDRDLQTFSQVFVLSIAS